jgi:hypothetical protein
MIWDWGLSVGWNILKENTQAENSSGSDQETLPRLGEEKDGEYFF